MDIKEIIKIVKKGGIGVMPTDTIYGLVGSAFSKEAIERIYEIKKRHSKSPMIILISSLKDLKKFNIEHSHILKNMRMLEKWPVKTSIVFPVEKKYWEKLKYLHRGTGNLAFRLPAKKSLTEIIKKTGPLVAPSANISYMKPSKNIIEAKKYFGNGVDFYLSDGTLKDKPSKLIKINKKGEIEVLRDTIKKHGK